MNTDTNFISDNHNHHNENMDSYMQYVEQIKNDSNELSFEQLDSYFTADDNERDRMWNENEQFCKQCYQQGKYYVQETTKRMIKKRLDAHGTIYMGEREVSLHYIHKTLGEDILQEVRDELCNIARFIMNDSEPEMLETTELFESVFH